MRIEAQGKYLQDILENAQKSLALAINSNLGNLESTEMQLINFDAALSDQIEKFKKQEIRGNIAFARRIIILWKIRLNDTFIEVIIRLYLQKETQTSLMSKRI